MVPVVAAGVGGYQVLLNGKNVTPKRIYTAALEAGGALADDLDSGMFSP